MPKSIPNCTVIGAPTGGSSGYPAPFELNNGWRYTILTWQKAGVQHNLIEDRGVLPDKSIPLESNY